MKPYAKRKQLDYYEVSALCYDWNTATSPFKLRTAAEHARMNRWARALKARLRALGAVEGRHYIESENSGRLSPLPNFPTAGRIS